MSRPYCPVQPMTGLIKMNLQYIFNNDSERMKHAEAHGYDPDTLFLLFKEVFTVSQDLHLTTKEAAETFYRLKNVYDFSQGQAMEPDIVVYENNASNPTRLAVEVRTTGQTFFFRVVPGQRTEKMQVLTKCETCREGEAIKRGEIKQHVLERHAFAGQS